MLVGRESEYVNRALADGWISSAGEFVERFEIEFASWVGAGNALTCSSGTTGLHLALLALGIGPGDEVIVPDLTYIASANAVTYVGATPVLVDVDCHTWGLSASTIAEAVTERTRAIMVVHLYGHPVDFGPIEAIARERGILIIEDAAEALAASYRGRMIGTLGDVGVFSFFGNKVLTSGEGGMVVTDDNDIAERVRLFRGQGQDPTRRYFHTEVGYNYRLTNVQAAIGLAQLEMVDWHLGERKRVVDQYRHELAGLRVVEQPGTAEWAVRSDWLHTVLLRDFDREARDGLIRALAEAGIETRPTFFPISDMPPYRDAVTAPGGNRVSADLSRRGISLPTHSGLSQEDVSRVCSTLKGLLSLH